MFKKFINSFKLIKNNATWDWTAVITLTIISAVAYIIKNSNLQSIPYLYAFGVNVVILLAIQVIAMSLPKFDLLDKFNSKQEESLEVYREAMILLDTTMSKDAKKVVLGISTAICFVINCLVHSNVYYINGLNIGLDIAAFVGLAFFFCQNHILFIVSKSIERKVSDEDAT